jgi:nucleoid-associated protein YgaU
MSSFASKSQQSRQAIPAKPAVAASRLNSPKTPAIDIAAPRLNPKFHHSLSQMRLNAPTPQRSFREATNSSASALPHRQTMESAFGEDFSGVRTYLGQRRPMDNLNAHAATAGEQIAFASASPDKQQVAHELAHVVQHRRNTPPSTGQRSQASLSQPSDPAEQEAATLAPRAAAGERVAVHAPPAAAIHRDIKNNDLKVPLGHFEIDMKQQNVANSSTGEKGHISFTPSATSPDTRSIRLSQAGKQFNVDINADAIFHEKAALNKMSTTGSDKTHTTAAGDTLDSISQSHYGDATHSGQIFTANSAALSATMKTADGAKALPAKLSLTLPGAVAGGFFLDHLPTDPKAKVRHAKADPEVPSDYVWPGEEVAGSNQHGSKAGNQIVPAILDDTPASLHKRHLRYTFETIARSVDLGIEYGAVHWGFDADGSTGKVIGESVSVSAGVSDTYHAALDNFNKFYKNPHTVVANETLQTIAQKYYGDPAKSAEILKANHAKLPHPDHILPGLKLNIPIIGP